MGDQRPADHNGPTIVPHDPDCHACPHRWHLLPCEHPGCGCLDHTRPGLD